MADQDSVIEAVGVGACGFSVVGRARRRRQGVMIASPYQENSDRPRILRVEWHQRRRGFVMHTASLVPSSDLGNLKVGSELSGVGMGQFMQLSCITLVFLQSAFFGRDFLPLIVRVTA